MIGKKIRMLRFAKELTQRELGDKIGIKQFEISNIENGSKKLTPELIKKLAEELEVGAEELKELEELNNG